MHSRWCVSCWESNEGIYSDLFGAVLCDDCFNQRCRDDGEPIALEDLEELSEEIGI